MNMPGSATELRQFLCCQREGEYYDWDCVHRKCGQCKDNLRTLFTTAEMGAVPSIKHQAWSEVPYVCKYGRELKNHDFLPAEMKIDEYITMLDTDPQQLLDLLPHHNRAKFLNSDRKLLFDDVSRVDENIRRHKDYDVDHW